MVLYPASSQPNVDPQSTQALYASLLDNISGVVGIPLAPSMTPQQRQANSYAVVRWIKDASAKVGHRVTVKYLPPMERPDDLYGALLDNITAAVGIEPSPLQRQDNSYAVVRWVKDVRRQIPHQDLATVVASE